MEKVITIPREMARKGELVLIPRKEFEEFLKLKKKRGWEGRDTDEAIRVFNEEKKETY